MPFRVLYKISDFAKYLLMDVLKYRVEVVKKQLRTSFPEKSETEIEDITQKFYIQLADLFLEGIKGFSLTKAQLLARWKVLNPEIIDAFQAKGQSVIINAAHYCNFEWGTLAIAFQLKHTSKGVYKPLRNKYINKYLKKNRSRTGLELLEMNQVGRKLLESYKNNCAFIFISDQSPSNVFKAYWIDFLHQSTPFIHGVDQFARSLNLPVFYLDVQRTKRGYYEITFSPLVMNPEELEAGQITRIYAEKIEEVVIKNPANWLWSHKRWKHKMPEDQSVISKK